MDITLVSTTPFLPSIQTTINTLGVVKNSKDHLYQQLTQALISELASGMFQPGTRFHSNRSVCRLWQVSQPTAKSAFRLLLDNDLLEVKDRSGYYVTDDSQRKALLLLYQTDSDSLPAPETWKEKSQKLSLRAPTGPYRVGVILPLMVNPDIQDHIDTDPDKLLGFPPEIRALLADLFQRGCEVRLFVDDRSDECRKRIISLILQERLSGVIAIRRNIDYAPLEPIATLLLQHHLPVVTVFDDCEGLNVTSVNLNNIGLGYEAGRRFQQIGCDQIAVLVPPRSNYYYYKRLVGCRMALKDNDPHNQKTVKIIVNPNDPDISELRTLLQDRQGEICGLFLTSAGYIHPVLQLLATLKLQVPEDISVLAVTGTPGRFANDIPCDTIQLDFNEIGTRAADAIIRLIEGKATSRAILTGFSYRSVGTLRTLTRSA